MSPLRAVSTVLPAARQLLFWKRLVRSPITSISSLTVVLLLSGLVYAAAGRAQQAPPAESEPKVFEVVARRFVFEPATIEVTEGDRVRLVVRSADGPHGVEIKAFKVKKAVP